MSGSEYRSYQGGYRARAEARAEAEGEAQALTSPDQDVADPQAPNPEPESQQDEEEVGLLGRDMHGIPLWFHAMMIGGIVIAILYGWIVIIAGLLS